MGHFARVDDQNIVREVIVVANAGMDDLPFPDSEPVGQAMLAESGFEGRFIQCSRNANFRGAYPSEGWKYYPDVNIFLPPGE